MSGLARIAGQLKNPLWCSQSFNLPLVGRDRIELSQIQVLQTCALPTELPPPEFRINMSKNNYLCDRWENRTLISRVRILVPGHLAEPTKTKNGLLIFDYQQTVIFVNFILFYQGSIFFQLSNVKSSIILCYKIVCWFIFSL